MRGSCGRGEINWEDLPRLEGSKGNGNRRLARVSRIVMPDVSWAISGDNSRNYTYCPIIYRYRSAALGFMFFGLWSSSR